MFARSRHLTRGQYFAFEYDGDETLSVKIFRADGGCKDCYMESDSSSHSSCYDEEDEDEDEDDSLSVKAERSLMSTTRFYSCRLVGPPSAEVCSTAILLACVGANLSL